MSLNQLLIDSQRELIDTQTKRLITLEMNYRVALGKLGGLVPFMRAMRRSDATELENFVLRKCSELNETITEVEEFAITQAIEAQRAATGNTDAVEDESAVGNADAPKGA